jgi:hypothetical protein
VLINYFIFLSMLFLFSGLALDAGMLQPRKLQLQHAADAVALGAIYEKGREYSNWVAAGKADAALNGFTDDVSGVIIAIVSPPTAGSYAGNTSAVHATVSQTYHTGFMGLISNSGNATPGTGVTFYLTNGGGYSYANFNINNSTVTLSAPTSGGLTGIVVFVDRNWSHRGSQGIQINSSYVTTNGIWYALNTGIYNFSSTLRGTTYLGLVVDNINAFSATFTVPAPDYSSLAGGSPFQGSSVGGLVQ